MKDALFLLFALLIFTTTSVFAAKLRIDGATQETTTASIQAMYAAHGNRETCLLQTAILRIQIGDKAEQVAKTGDKNAAPTPLGPKIDGMTYKEVIKFSKKYPEKVKGLCRD